MLQSILLILVVIATFQIISYVKRQEPAKRGKLVLRSVIGMLIVVLIMIALTGRIHWIFALIGALIPFMRGFLGLGIQLLPLWLRRKHFQNSPNQKNDEREKAQSRSNEMSPKEALDILGLNDDIAKGTITPEMINHAHRRLIHKLHPDRGGNNYLAAKINLARDILLKDIHQA